MSRPAKGDPNAPSRPKTGKSDELEELRGRIRRYLQLADKPELDWQQIKIFVEDGFGPRFSDKSISPRDEVAPQMFKDEPMPKSTSRPKTDDRRQAVTSTSLIDLLIAVVDDPAAWLSLPSVHFGGRKPSDLVGTDEEHKIVDLLLAVDQGLF